MLMVAALGRSLVFVAVLILQVHASFLSRPDIKAPALTVHVNRLSDDDQGLLFVTPYFYLTSLDTYHDGPVIYDLQGALVWDGYHGSATGHNKGAHNLRPLHYQGTTHLAYTATRWEQSRWISTHTILNTSYDTVEELRDPGNRVVLDPHDYEIIDEKKILQAGSITHHLGGHETVLKEAVLQLLDISSKRIEFEWRSLDHVPPNDTCMGLAYPDYFHINSVTQDPNGNDIISGYSICTVLSISSSTGAILWRLGGPLSSFTFVDNYTLSHVHHVRVVPLSAINIPSSAPGGPHAITPHTHLALSMFDNAMNRYEKSTTASCSSAIIVLLDFEAMTAQVVERYLHPRGEYARIFGSVQILPNGDRFIGWGSTRQVSQHTRDGVMVYHAEMGDRDRPELIGSLRAFKSKEWVGRPRTRGPDLYSNYSWTCGRGGTKMYASWNGATEVERWAFYGGRSEDGPWVHLGVMEREGFETAFLNEGFWAFGYVEAVGKGGEGIGRSRGIRTRVPAPKFSEGCGQWRYPEKSGWKDDSEACDGYRQGAVAKHDQEVLGLPDGFEVRGL
ncbi:MAG: hypothetical protein Q9222_002476 [Ikaeria aurantiellina]